MESIPGTSYLGLANYTLRATGSFNPFARPNYADIKLILEEQGTIITDRIY